MNKIIISLVSFSVLFLFSCGKDNTPTPDNKTDKKDGTTQTDTKSDQIDPAKAVKVEFEVKGDMAGTITAWYKGNKGKVDYKMEAAGRQVSSQIYSDNQWMYMITEFDGTKQGMKFNAKKFAEQSKDKNQQIDVTSFRDNLKNYKKIGKETILGKECDIYEIKPGHTISVYKEQVPLKMVINEKTTMVAKRYETNLDLNDDFFSAPQDVKYTDMENFKEGMENMKDMKNMDRDKLDEMMKKYQNR